MSASGTDPGRFKTVAALFDRLRLVPEAVREERLMESCAGDAALAAEVRELLEFHHQPETELDRGVLRRLPGTMIGRYRVERLLGEGGMGTVYLASQRDPVERQVALKVVKLGMDTRQVVRRFESERQVLARMEHPNIAHVLDGGVTSDGRPYFVMELVEGRPITEYCDAHRLGVRERIGLFLQVCSAVQHAHQKGVIHRDLKPGNVLVADLDGRPAPKVIDFGVAKAIDESRPIAGTAVTSAGMMVGTPDYMSPEQAGLGGDVDTRSDVFALGILLYELLVGETPLRARATRADSTHHSLDELRRRVREEMPLRPSSAVDGRRTQPSERRISAIAECRATDARSLRRTLEEDLDWIVLMALAKEPTRRYGTVAALGSDLLHYLRHEPVEARPPSFGYLALRFAQRHTSVIIGVGVATIALLGGLTLSLLAMREATLERDVASEALRREAEVSRALKAELFASNIERARAASREGQLRSARQMLWTALIAQPESMSARWALREFLILHPNTMSRVLAGRTRPVAFVENDSGLFVAPANGSPRILDAATGLDRRVFNGPAIDASDIALSSDGLLAATGAANGRVDLWDMSAGEWRGTLLTHGKGATSVEFDPDGSALYSAGADGRILRTPLPVASPMTPIFESDVAVSRLAIARDGTLAAGFANGDVRIFRGGEVQGLPRHSNGISAIAFDDAGTRLATAGANRSARIYDLNSNAVIDEIRPDLGTLRDLRFADNDQSLLLLSWTELSRVDLATHAITTDCGDAGWRVAVSRNGLQSVISGGSSASVRSWRRGPIARPEDALPSGWTARLVTGPDGGFIATSRNAISMIRADRTVDWTFQLDSSTHTCARSRDGRRLASGSHDGHLRVVSIPDGKCLVDRDDFARGEPRIIAFDGTGELVVYANRRSVTLLDLRDLSAHRVLDDLPGEVLGVAITPDGRRVAASVRGTGVYVRDLDHQEPRVLLSVSSVFPVAFVDGGRTIVAGSWRGELLAFDAEKGLQLALREHGGLVNGVVPHPTDEQLVLSYGADGGVRLWNRIEGTCVLATAPFGRNHPIRTAGFNDDGDLIVVTSAAGDVVRWSIKELDARIELNREADLRLLEEDMAPF